MAKACLGPSTKRSRLWPDPQGLDGGRSGIISACLGRCGNLASGFVRHTDSCRDRLGGLDLVAHAGFPPASDSVGRVGPSSCPGASSAAAIESVGRGASTSQAVSPGGAARLGGTSARRRGSGLAAVPGAGADPWCNSGISDPESAHGTCGQCGSAAADRSAPGCKPSSGSWTRPFIALELAQRACELPQ